MESTNDSACRICGTHVTATHCVTLFSRESLATSTPDRLSKVAAVPVARDDGLSRVICRPCNRKFLVAESFQVTAKCTYEKSVYSATRKRSKDTSGIMVSPHTEQCRPVAKRLTWIPMAGRRLVFPTNDDDSQCKNNK